MRTAFGIRWVAAAASAAMLLVLTAACTTEVEVPGETVVVEKEVIKEIQVPGETVVVEKEVVKEVEVVKTVVKEVEKADPSLTPQYGGTGILLMNDWLNLKSLQV